MTGVQTCALPISSLTQHCFAPPVCLSPHCSSGRQCGHSIWLHDAKSKLYFRCAGSEVSRRGFLFRWVVVLNVRLVSSTYQVTDAESTTTTTETPRSDDLLRKPRPHRVDVELVLMQILRFPFASFRFEKVTSVDMQGRRQSRYRIGDRMDDVRPHGADVTG